MKRLSGAKRILSILFALILSITLLPISAAAAEPNGWWPIWKAYSDAANAENPDVETIIRTGQAVLDFYSQYPLEVSYAEKMTLVCQKRLELLYFENKGDYDAAVDNTAMLRDLTDYLVQNGRDLNDLYIRAVDHLELLEPIIGVYAVSYTQHSDYDSAIVPVSGSLYGSVHQGYLAGNGTGQGSIASVYVELGDQTAAQFDYLIRPILSGGQTLQLNLNFPKMGADARAVPTGAYDANLNTTLRYLASLSRPVLLRIGGEMNLWSDAANPTSDYVTPADFIRAYRYIAELARSLCPNAELVWSPGDVTRWGEDFEMFWPGDAYVDWVGMSFYYNYGSEPAQLPWQEHARLGRFADPILLAKGIVELARRHGKPVAATEGGAYKNGAMGEAYASAQVAKEFAAVNMVYPEVRSLVYFDMALDGHDYTMTGTMRAQTLAAIAENPTLISRGETSAAAYVPAEAYRESPADGKVLLGAFGCTYNDRDMTVAYALDGAALPCSGPVNRAVIDTNVLPTGAHDLRVVFSDSRGYKEARNYRVDIASGGEVKISVGAVGTRLAFRKTQEIDLDGRKITLPTFAIEELGGQTNYVRVRDLAAVMNGTAGQFNVDWNGALFAIDLAPRTPYTTMNGTELTPPFTGDMPYANNTSKILVNGAETPMQAFVIYDGGAGHTYFKLRDLGRALGFQVGWSADRGIYIESALPYSG